MRQNGEYERLFQASGAKRGEDGKHCVNAVCGYCEPGEDTFPYMICALKKPGVGADGFKVAQIPKAAWAVFRGSEHDDMGAEIPSLFARAYSEWLPSSGYEKDTGPDMEIYYTAYHVFVQFAKIDFRGGGLVAPCAKSPGCAGNTCSAPRETDCVCGRGML
ncbi:MAG: GyrI-like domain-containing protein [Oscillospiraceae bacterium]|nr:GyrI-like domain-containing protein [Oscillospiraceae bacterium]